jgi:hypothetical protein
MGLDSALSLVFIGLSSALVALMASRRVFRSLPLFFTYVCFDLGTCAAGLMIYHCSGASIWYWRTFLFQLTGDSLIYFCVLVEMGKNLLRFNRESRLHGALAVVLFAGAAVAIGALAKWTVAPGRSLLLNICFFGMRVNGDLQFAGFLALAGWSGLRKLHWPDRELRIATGFGFIAFVWFLISILHSQWSTGPVYYWIYQAGEAAGSITVAYWLHSFWFESGAQVSARDAYLAREGRRGPDDSEPTQCLRDV